jgi:hypothetical protein
MSVRAKITRLTERRLWLTYYLRGATGLRLSHEGSRIEKHRRDALWEHTCCELFFKGRGGAYYEFNFAPSGDWALYRFASYRDEATKPEFVLTGASSHRHGDFWSLTAHLDLSTLPDIPDGAWEIGLSAVAEMKDGSKSYWALTHPADKPDFHHPDSFAFKVPEPA